tara:strand:- start:80 stop:1066 length:987 start_codon:yes stop_codon:yes gene_type:complete
MENIVAFILLFIMLYIDNSNGIKNIENFKNFKSNCKIRGKDTKIIQEEPIFPKKIPKKCSIEHFLPQKNVWILNLNEISSRFWKNFRSRRVPQNNSGIEDFCLESIKKNLGKNFKINILNLKNLSFFLPEKYEILQECKDITIFKNLLKYSILEKYGGLWLPLDTLVLREFNIGYLNTDKLILFKKNPKYINFDEGFSDEIIFCLKGNIIIQKMVKLIENKLSTFQNNMLFNKYLNKNFNFYLKSKGSFIYNNISVQKLADGNNIQINNIFSINNLYIENLDKKVFFSINLEEINKHTEYNFLERLSKKQILNSNLYLAFLIKYAMKL